MIATHFSSRIATLPKRCIVLQEGHILGTDLIFPAKLDWRPVLSDSTEHTGLSILPLRFQFSVRPSLVQRYFAKGATPSGQALVSLAALYILIVREAFIKI